MGADAPDGLGPHVKSLRDVRKLTQDELAARSGLATDTIRRLEHEDFSPSLRTLKKVARGLKITLLALISSWTMSDSEIPRSLAALLATRSRHEQQAFAHLWTDLVPELDAFEAQANVAAEHEPAAQTPTGRSFGRHLRSLRRARGMTQEVLAERCQLSADTIRRLEHGSFSPSLDTLGKLCTGLDLQLSTLFESYELGDPNFKLQIFDLLWLRPPAQRAFGYRMLRSILELLDALERTR